MSWRDTLPRVIVPLTDRAMETTLAYAREKMPEFGGESVAMLIAELLHQRDMVSLLQTAGTSLLMRAREAEAEAAKALVARDAAEATAEQLEEDAAADAYLRAGTATRAAVGVGVIVRRPDGSILMGLRKGLAGYQVPDMIEERLKSYNH
mgnify:FL=1